MGAQRKKGKPSLHKHTMPDIKIVEGNWPVQLNGARRSRSFFLQFLSPQPSPFMSQPVHGVREASLGVTRGLLAAADQLPGPHALPAYSMSRATWQLSATFANSQYCRKREILSPSPCNPTTCNASLHTLLSRSLFRLPTKLRLHSPTLDYLGSPFSFLPPTRDVRSITVSSFFRNYVQGDERTAERRGYGCRH